MNQKNTNKNIIYTNNSSLLPSQYHHITPKPAPNHPCPYPLYPHLRLIFYCILNLIESNCLPLSLPPQRYGRLLEGTFGFDKVTRSSCRAQHFWGEFFLLNVVFLLYAVQVLAVGRVSGREGLVCLISWNVWLSIVILHSGWIFQNLWSLRALSSFSPVHMPYSWSCNACCSFYQILRLICR